MMSFKSQTEEVYSEPGGGQVAAVTVAFGIMRTKGRLDDEERIKWQDGKSDLSKLTADALQCH